MLTSIEKYPVKTVVISNALSLSIYALGVFIIFSAGPIYTAIYGLYILFLETRIIKNHCVNCYYYGKRCGFGKGIISSYFFSKGDQAKFCAAVITWKDMLPDLLVVLVPLTAGIVLIIMEFNLFLLIAMLIIILLSTTGNAFIRGKLTCNYCRQREIGCPAHALFNHQKK